MIGINLPAVSGFFTLMSKSSWCWTFNHPFAIFRHIGDLGNVEEDDEGRVDAILTDHLVKLSGNYSVMGKSVVVSLGVCGVHLMGRSVVVHTSKENRTSVVD